MRVEFLEEHGGSRRGGGGPRRAFREVRDITYPSYNLA